MGFVSSNHFIIAFKNFAHSFCSQSQPASLLETIGIMLATAIDVNKWIWIIHLALCKLKANTMLKKCCCDYYLIVQWSFSPGTAYRCAIFLSSMINHNSIYGKFVKVQRLTGRKWLLLLICWYNIAVWYPWSAALPVLPLVHPFHISGHSCRCSLGEGAVLTQCKTLLLGCHTRVWTGYKSHPIFMRIQILRSGMIRSSVQLQ